MMNWPRPESGKEVLGFLGLSGYYRKCIDHYAQIALPLYSLTQLKKKDFVCNEECERAFTLLNHRLATAPVLSLPTPDGEWIVRSDASKEALGAVLIQRQQTDTPEKKEKEERVLAYWSRKLTGAETRYPTYDSELLAIREAVLHWRYYLHGVPFTVYTDHAALQRILSQRTLSTRQITYLEVLQSYDFKVRYWPGARNTIADALSRRPDYTQETVEADDQWTLAERPGEKWWTTEELRNKCEEEIGEQVDLRVIEMLVESGADWVQGIKDGYRKDVNFGIIREICMLRSVAKDKQEMIQLVSEKIMMEKGDMEEVKEYGKRAMEIGREAKRWMQAAERYRLEDGLLYQIIH